MTTRLAVPLHMPIKLAENLLRAELKYREVESVKVIGGFMIIKHSRLLASVDEGHIEL